MFMTTNELAWSELPHIWMFSWLLSFHGSCVRSANYWHFSARLYPYYAANV